MSASAVCNASDSPALKSDICLMASFSLFAFACLQIDVIKDLKRLYKPL